MNQILWDSKMMKTSLWNRILSFLLAYVIALGLAFAWIAWALE